MLESQNVEREAQRLLTEMNQNNGWYRKHTFMSCWHCNEYESEAMWKLYSVNTQNAVAIQTTAAHLYEALDREPSIVIGKVQYIDYDHRFSSVNGAYWVKRKSFEHEREVRAIAFNYKSTTGILVPIDVGTLIDSVYISPYAPKWFEEVIRSVADKYDLAAPIVDSEMSKRPFY